MAKDFTKTTMPTSEEEEFEKLLADLGGGGQTPDLQRGDMVKGTIIACGPEFTFVDLGGKAEGTIESREVAELELKVGDILEAVVVGLGSEIRLSRSLANDVRNKEMIQDAFDMGLPIEGKIAERNKGGFEVQIAGERAFMPVSQLAIEMIEDLDVWVGRTERFLIKEYSTAARRFVVSRADLQRREREVKAVELWETLAVGDVKTGKVTSIQDYGCFVDIGGVDGLVHIKEMQWSRLEHPSELVSAGEEITVTVTSMDKEKKRIGLSMKSAEADPWKLLGVDIKENEIVTGEVTRIERFGAFVEILPGVEGLVHVSEISHTQHVRHPRDVVEPGQKVQVMLQKIDHVARRVSLSMKAVEGDPWMNVAEEFSVGQTLTGAVERVAPFGIFVMVSPGVTALLPGSETLHPRGTDLARHYRPGDTIGATVLSVDAENKRMSLSQKAGEEAAERANVARYQADTKKGAKGLGTFADLLKDFKVD